MKNRYIKSKDIVYKIGIFAHYRFFDTIGNNSKYITSIDYYKIKVKVL